MPMYQPKGDCNPYEVFKGFYENPFIKSIKDNKRWTISTNCIDEKTGRKKKMPLDINAMIFEDRFAGATFSDEKCLTDLDTICKYVPDAMNNTYYLDALIDGFVVLDIEPKCPVEIKNKLLQLNYAYGEISMSGQGIHLIFPLPDCISEYPIAQKKLALREKNGYYEILLNHYITFTRNIIQPATGNGDFISVFRELAMQQTEQAEAKDISISDLEPDDIPMKDTIVSLLSRSRYKKTIKDFDNDDSTYEFAYIGFLHYKLKNILKTYAVRQNKHNYDDNDKAWILYEVAQQVLPSRAKHKEMRTGLPWLLFIAKQVIAKDTSK